MGAASYRQRVTHTLGRLHTDAAYMPLQSAYTYWWIILTLVLAVGVVVTVVMVFMVMASYNMKLA